MGLFFFGVPHSRQLKTTKITATTLGFPTSHPTGGFSRRPRELEAQHADDADPGHVDGGLGKRNISKGCCPKQSGITPLKEMVQ